MEDTATLALFYYPPTLNRETVPTIYVNSHVINMISGQISGMEQKRQQSSDL